MKNSEQLRYDWAAIADQCVQIRVYYRDENGSYKHYGNPPIQEVKNGVIAEILDNVFRWPEVKGYIIVGNDGQGDAFMESGDTIENELGFRKRK